MECSTSLKHTQTNKQTNSIGPEFHKKLSMLLKTKSRRETCVVGSLWMFRGSTVVLYIVGYFAWKFETGWRGAT